MPVPRTPEPPHKADSNDIKLRRIENALDDMGYDCNGVRSIIEIIENCDLDKSQFDFPFGSYDTFKVHVLIGYYDDLENPVLHHMTDDEYAELQKAIRGGKIWVTY